MFLKIANSFFLLATFLIVSAQIVFGQAGTYYNSINPNATSFITDLQNRIRVPYTQVSYNNFDETNIANFASFDNGNGTRSVFCVYSHYEYIYSGTFTWIPLSREHTFCHSWQPGYPSESLPEYSDQYHLFPTHQDNANGVRSNHPLGNIVNVISTFLEGTYGTDANGDEVYEPRDEHKGDAARALLYMPIKYNGISGYDWTFNWLNNTRLPSLSEGPQDLTTLIQWHKQDPPDKWEVDRNNYALPGTQVPFGYLLLANNTGVFTDPVDGIIYPTDTDLTDGSARVYINYSAADEYSFNGLTASTNYYFKIYSYNGNPGQFNYKTDGVVPTLSAQTLANGGGGAYSDLIISEYIEGSSNNKAIEIYNGTAANIDLTTDGYNLQYFYNGSTTSTLTINLAGTLVVGDVYVVAHSSADPVIIAAVDLTNGSGWFNGDDAIVLRKGTTIIDVIGQVGFDPGTEWGTGLISTADNTIRRKVTVTQGDTNPSDVFDPAIEWDGYAIDTFNGLGQYEGNLPVELTSFAGRVVGNSVLLDWVTATEINNYGFEVERMSNVKSQMTEVWEIIGFVAGNGNSSSYKYYSFADNNLQSGKYIYRLKQIDNDGAFEYSSAIEIQIVNPNKFTLYQNYPNPFNPSTVISFELPVNGFVSLKVFDVLGNEVAILVDEEKSAGAYNVEFRIKNVELGSGVYFYRLQSGDFIESRKMVILK